MLTALAGVRASELDRGVCLVGPHRDELELTIGGLPARGYASHGESWSLALALRLASFALLRQGREDPVLILDDVFAELDAGRRDRLAVLVAGAEQVLITAAVPADVPPSWPGARFDVRAGEIGVPADGRPTVTGWRPRRWPRPRRTREPGVICPLASAPAGAGSARMRRPSRGPPRSARTRRGPPGRGADVSGPARGRPRRDDPQRLVTPSAACSTMQGWQQRAAIGSVFGRWAEIVGADLAAHTTPDAFDDGELAVTADSTAWATQVRLLAPQLVRRLNAELGDGTVRRVKVRGPAPPRQRGALARSRRPRPARHVRLEKAKTALAVGARR